MVDKDLELNSVNHFAFSNNTLVFRVACCLAELSWIRIYSVDCNVIYCIFHEDKMPYAKPLLSSYASSCVEFSRMKENTNLIIASFEVLPF